MSLILQILCQFPGVCLVGKLSLFSDISQDSALEKMTLHAFKKCHLKKSLFLQLVAKNNEFS